MGKTDFRNSLLIFSIFLIIYYLGSFDKIPFGDCVGFVLNTEKGEFISETTSTVHFLYINTLVLLKRIFPFFSSESINAFVSMFSGALVVSIVYIASKQLSKKTWIAVATSFLFGFSFSFWRNAEIPEVYTMNSVFVALFILFSTKAIQLKKGIFLIFASLFFSIGFWVHIQNILLIPCFIYLLYLNRNQKKYLKGSILIFLVLFSSLFLQPLIDGKPLMYVFKSGIWVEQSFSKNIFDYAKDLVIAFGILFYNFWYFIIFGILGAYHLFQKNKDQFTFFLLGALPVFGFATFYEVSDNYVFFITFNIIFAIVSGFGILNIKSVRFYRLTIISIFFIPLFYLASISLAPYFESANKFDRFKSYKGGLDYYMLPWMNNNVGIIEFTIEKRKAPEPVIWMTGSANEYIELLKAKGYSEQEIKKL